MTIATWRRPGPGAWLALGLLFALPTMAEAQLFPNRTIKRQREACAAEPPFYGQVRRDYYGYFPTCWNRFPAGWGCPCPNPELPNPAAEFAKRPRDTRDPNAGEPGLGPDDDRAMPENPPGNDTNIPPIPNPGRSPFDIEGRPDTPAQPPAQPPAGGPATPPRTSNSGPAVQPGDNPSVPPATRAPASTGLMEIPRLPEISPTASNGSSPMEPGSMLMAPEATLASNTGPSRPDLGPLPSSPTPAASLPGYTPSVNAEAPSQVLGQPPAQAPRRRSLLGGLFNRSGTKR